MSSTVILGDTVVQQPTPVPELAGVALAADPITPTPHVNRVGVAAYLSVMEPVPPASMRIEA